MLHSLKYTNVMYTKFLIFQIIVGFGFHFISSITSQEVGDVEVVHSWVTVDFTWESEEDREEAIANGTYIVENYIVSGMKVHLHALCKMYQWEFKSIFMLV